jgi:hypothetical protein
MRRVEKTKKVGTCGPQSSVNPARNAPTGALNEISTKGAPFCEQRSQKINEKLIFFR